MNNTNWMELIITVLSGMVIALPLIVALIRYVKLAVSEKNWQSVLSFVMELMKVAESKFENGATRKEWVMSTLEGSAKFLNYNIDMDVISNMIDALCSMAKTINVKIQQEGKTK